MTGHLSELLLELQILIFILQLLRIIKVRFVLFQIRFERKMIVFFIYLTVSMPEVTKNREV
jgi:hypothetical protein